MASLPSRHAHSAAEIDMTVGKSRDALGGALGLREARRHYESGDDGGDGEERTSANGAGPHVTPPPS